jgi:hypothetical protein
MTNFLLYHLALALLFPVLALISYRLKILATLRKTYLFWAVFSVVNFGFLGPLAFPPLLLVESNWFGKFFWFLLPPFAASAAIAVITSISMRWVSPKLFISLRIKTWNVYISNAVFAIVFLLAGDQYKNYLIEKILATHKPDCIVNSSFFSSLLNAGEDFQFHAHAFYEEGGKIFYWSYSQRDFFEGNERLNQNFGCQHKR